MFKLLHITALVTSILIFASANVLQAQKIKLSKGESTIKIEDHISKEITEEKAIELAKIDAITKAFGEYIEQESNMDIENGKINFRSYGQTKVKGDWIRTIGQPELNYFYKKRNDNMETWVKCVIQGEVRKITSKANIEFEILSCPEKHCRTEKFNNNQDVFAFIKSPINGYLSIFLVDGETVYRLLPYRKMGARKSVKIMADKDYILFSRDCLNFDTLADRIELTTNKEQETNTFVAVFSENEFIKPLLFDERKDNEEFIIPKSLSKNSFEEWLGMNRATSSDFIDIEKKIIIKSK